MTNSPQYRTYMQPYVMPQLFPRPTAASDSGSAESAEAREKRIQEAAKAREEAQKKEIQLFQLKLENKELIDTINLQINDSIKQEDKYKKSLTVTKDKKVKQDSGVSGAPRWGANFVTMLGNAWDSFRGYDEKGNFSGWQLAGNIASIALGIGICCIPGGAYALAAWGAIDGVVGIVKGNLKLNEAEKKGNPREIDAAQQEICGGVFMTATSLLGSGVLGRIFRTASRTTTMASAAAVRTSKAGKAISGISNFGRDVSVNAWKAAKNDVAFARANGGMWKATKENFNNGIVRKFSFGKTKFNYEYNNLKTSLNNKLNDVNARLAAETDPAKRALLIEEKQFLETNIADFDKIGTTVKSKADYEQLVKDNKLSKDFIETAYTKNAAGKYEINGVEIEEADFLAYQKRVLLEQKAIVREMDNVIDSHAQTMRWYGYRPKKYAAELSEYISADSAKKIWYKPSTWFKSKYQIAIDGKNPSYLCKAAATVVTTPALNLTKTSALTVNPNYSNAMLLSMDVLPETVQQTIHEMQEYINAKKEILNKLLSASTLEEYEQAVNANNQLNVIMQQRAMAEQGMTPEQNKGQGQIQLTPEQQAVLEAQQLDALQQQQTQAGTIGQIQTT